MLVIDWKKIFSNDKGLLEFLYYIFITLCYTEFIMYLKFYNSLKITIPLFVMALLIIISSPLIIKAQPLNFDLTIEFLTYYNIFYSLINKQNRSIISAIPAFYERPTF